MGPLPRLTRKQMRLIFMVDASGSMSVDGKMDTLNLAMAKVQREIRQVAARNLHANVMVQAMRFSSGASWTTPEPVAVENFQWQAISADKLSEIESVGLREMEQPSEVTANALEGSAAEGAADFGKAVSLLADSLKSPQHPSRALPPMIYLLSDGKFANGFEVDLDNLNQLKWAIKAQRFSVAIGPDVNYENLKKFTNNIVNPEDIKDPDDNDRFVDGSDLVW